ncbi:MAG: hypothetical protein BAJATHORv1_10259 [Candidatus Thorarchaeota archaeon]|nr:MAG: hypothetical protein BAJATHORv1_10259 [Candidatus Thorarchaeota archaeon]
MKDKGWLLDATIDYENRELILWIKKDGRTKGYSYNKFYPSIFIHKELDRDTGWTWNRFIQSVKEHPKIVNVEREKKYVSIYDREKSPVIRIYTTVDSQREVARDLEDRLHTPVYHADISPIQQFFIENEMFPFGRIEFERIGNKITSITSLDDREAIEYELPDLEEIGIEVLIQTEAFFPQDSDPIHNIVLFHKGRKIRIREENEEKTLCKLQEYIDSIDPDVIVTQGGDNQLFRYLFLRAKKYDIELSFSRDRTRLTVQEGSPGSYWQYNQIVFRSGNQVTFRGRIHIDNSGSPYYSPSGIEGVIEGCRLAFAPPQRVSRMTIGAVNAAVQFYNAYKMDILIPPIKKNPEYLKSASEIANIDRGGLIFQPRPDIYENVVECDFASMYPTLMVTRNISPETICIRTDCPYDYRHCIDVPELQFRICGRKRGLVAESLELIIRKRDGFKKLISDGQMASKYKKMQNTLKGILVSCFGYLGFRNARFGRVEAHTAVTAFAREVLLKTREIAEEMNLEIVHGIVDSIWIRGKDISHDHIQEFCNRVSERVDIKMSMKGVYQWLVIPSSRTHPAIAPLNRYYGVFINGSIKTRGIETRRRDTCLYVGDCQKEMIRTLARGKSKQEFIRRIIKAYQVCQQYIERLQAGDVDIRDLVLHSRLTRDPDQYRATSRSALVAKQLVKIGRDIHAGQKVRYLMTEADSETPIRRVCALELVKESTRYDVEAYSRLCIRAFENLIPAQYLDKKCYDQDYEEMLLTDFC